MTKRYRPPIPMRVKLRVVLRQVGKCSCGCDEKLGTIENTEFDHCPPLALREYDPETRIYVPDANDPDKLTAKIKVHHREKTNHPRGLHTTLGSDRHLIDKTKPKRLANFKVNKPPLGEPRELTYSRGGDGKPEHKSKIRSRGFDKTRSRRFDGSVTARKRPRRMEASQGDIDG